MPLSVSASVLASSSIEAELFTSLGEPSIGRVEVDQLGIHGDARQLRRLAATFRQVAEEAEDSDRMFPGSAPDGPAAA